MNIQILRVMLFLLLGFHLLIAQSASFSADNVYIVDVEEKYCLAVYYARNRYKRVDYIDVRLFNKKNIDSSYCRKWRISNLGGDLYKLFSNENRNLHIDKKGVYRFKEKESNSTESFFKITESNDGNVKIKNFAHGTYIGITSNGRIAESGEQMLKIVKNLPSKIEEITENTEDGYQNSQNNSNNDNYQSNQGVEHDNNQQHSEGNQYEQDNYSSQQHSEGSQYENDNYDNQQHSEVNQHDGESQHNEGEQESVAEPYAEEQKRRLQNANHSFDAGLVSEAFQEYQALANEGMGIAQYYTGAAYHRGKGVEKSVPHTLKWYGIAADNNIPEASYYLAKMYYNGDDIVARNYQKASYWILKALDAFDYFKTKQDQLSTQYLYAQMLEYGHGVQRDRSRALRLYKVVMRGDRHHFPIGDDIKRVENKIKEDTPKSNRIESFRRF